MNKTLRISLMVSGVLIFIALVVSLVVFFIYRPGSDNSTMNDSANENASITTSGSVPVVSSNANIDTATNTSIEATETTVEDLEIIALYFAERFGSYSNHTETAYQNFEELYIYMTDEMKAWAEDYVATEREKDTSQDVYYGITTKALVSENTLFNENSGEAVFMVSTQRRETQEDIGDAVVRYQDILIRFSRIDTIWKVAEARWQEVE